MTTTHTPGPWQAKDSLTRWHVTTTTTPRTYNICSINSERIEQEANARLIASAPALYAALQYTRDMLEVFTDKGLKDIGLNIVLEQAIAALAIADGEVRQ